jgi:hypothetical protein
MCATVCAATGADWDPVTGFCTLKAGDFVFEIALLGPSKDDAHDSRLMVSVVDGVAKVLGVQRASVVMLGVEAKFTRRRLQARALASCTVGIPAAGIPAACIKSGETWLLFKIKVAGTDASLPAAKLIVADASTFGTDCVVRINEELGNNWATLYSTSPITSVTNVGVAEMAAFAVGAANTALQSKYGNNAEFAAAVRIPTAAEKANDQILGANDPDSGKSADQMRLERAVRGRGTDPFCYNEGADKYVLHFDYTTLRVLVLARPQVKSHGCIVLCPDVHVPSTMNDQRWGMTSPL